MKTIQSVEKAFRVLDCIAAGNGRRSMTEIARELEMSPATLHGFLVTLEGLGAIARDPHAGGYSIGDRMLRYSLMADASGTLARLILPRLAALRSKTKETVHLAIPEDGGSIRYIAAAEGAYPVRLASLVGKTERAEDAALGPVLFEDLARVHPRGIVCRRRCGRTLCMKQEPELDAVCIAAGFSYGPRQASKAGISIVVPRFRFAAEGEDFYVGPLIEEVQAAERAAGSQNMEVSVQ